MTIIAALDFAKASSDVAKLAAGLAQKLGDTLLLVHVAEPLVTTYEYGAGAPLPLPMPWPTEAPPSIEVANALLKSTREGLAGGDLEIETRVLSGAPERMLEELASETQARLMVMGTHGRGAVGRLLVGSVAQHLMRWAPCPVLVIRDGASASSIRAWLSGERTLRVVAGVDRHGRATDGALDWLRRLGALGPCEMTLVHEFWPPAEYTRLKLRGPRDLFGTDPEVASILERELEAKIGTLAWAPNARLRARAAWGAIGEALAREAASALADLVVIGSEQAHGWQRVKHASVAVSTLHAVEAPLLCVPVSPRSIDRAGADTPGALAVAPAWRSVLVATDLSVESNAAISQAYALLRAEGGVVHLCHVVEGPLPSPIYAYAADEGAALTPSRRAELEGALRSLIPPEAERLEIETRISIVDGGNPAEQIAAAALRVGGDAIVLSSHGRSGVKRLVLGSVAEAVLRQAEMPVIVVRGPSLAA